MVEELHRTDGCLCRVVRSRAAYAAAHNTMHSTQGADFTRHATINELPLRVPLRQNKRTSRVGLLSKGAWMSFPARASGGLVVTCPVVRAPGDAPRRAGRRPSHPHRWLQNKRQRGRRSVPASTAVRMRRIGQDLEESAEVHHASSESLGRVFPSLQSRFVQTYISAIAAAEGVSCPPADLIAQVGRQSRPLQRPGSPTQWRVDGSSRRRPRRG